ncbi:heparan-alpha-glucosaminide N-acetyltransferase domain-containing protein [Agromyces sp. Root81]|uniref:heparan-alpha-glucosaminide N-acetyltransferase domain-containing protein n=1 Tax=Agromyces sp. Root81 TaxID=1736601 RepID=UPI00138F4B6A|nr:heparan-alpha-glucosaminide N-acetyltransferase domain-containing protein [Agromyces sp. Root81]
MTTATQPDSPRTRTARSLADRVIGLDLARFLALIGMMATHLWVGGDEAPALTAALEGKAAALFALLAGVGIVLTTRTALAEGRVGAASLAVFGRGLALIFVGLTLGLLPNFLLVILVYYGVTFWLVIPMLRWSSSALIALAAAWAVLWPFLSSILRAPLRDPIELESANWANLADPITFVRGLFVSGAYPAFTWVVYTMIGMVVGRLIVAAWKRGAIRSVGLRLAAVGVVVAVAASGLSALLAGPLGGLAALAHETPADGAPVRQVFYAQSMGAPVPGNLWWLTSPAPHSGTFFDLAITTGTALFTIGLCLAIGSAMNSLAKRILAPVTGAGGAPLTIYAAHIVAASVALILTSLAGADSAGRPPWQIDSPQLWALHIAGALLIGWVLTLIKRRGPLETFVSWSGRCFAKLSHDRRGTPRRRLDG